MPSYTHHLMDHAKKIDEIHVVLGQRITIEAKNYLLDSPIHRGGNGCVFRIIDQDDRSIKALKVLKRIDEQSQDRFKNEIAILKELNSLYVAPCYGSGYIIDKRMACYVSELGGKNIRQLILGEGNPPRGGVKWTTKQIKERSVEFIRGITHFHSRGIIHRDIKPENVVLKQTTKKIMIVDFGIAKHVDADYAGRKLEEFTRTREHVGPEFYSSPELIAYARDKRTVVDRRSDLWQAGRVIWFMATGITSTGIPDVDDDPFKGKLHSIVVNMIHDKPAKRIQTAEEVEDQLSKL